MVVRPLPPLQSHIASEPLLGNLFLYHLYVTIMINLHKMIATRRCSMRGHRSVHTFRYPSWSTVSVSTAISRQEPVHATFSSTSIIRTFTARSNVDGSNGVFWNPTLAAALNLLQLQTQQQRLKSTVALPLSTYETSVEVFPSIVIGPDRSIEPQGSFAEAQAQVRLVIQSILRSLSSCILWCIHPRSP